MQTTLSNLRGGIAPLPQRKSTTCRAVQQTVQETSAPSSSLSSSPVKELYIGFKKDEGGVARAGRKGRFIRDDIRKYPSRDSWGTGGWAGGEAGLWELREAVLNDTQAQKKKAPAPAPKSSGTKSTKGGEPIYLGFGKDELELRKSGAKGRVIVDDPKKYPGKEDIGPLAGVVGGFAGGEAGLKGYVTTGEVRLRQPGEAGRKQFSPLTLAGAIALAGAVGGVVLDAISDAGENKLSTEVLQRASIDGNTKYLILAALGLVGAGGLIVAASAAVKAVQEKLQESAKNAGNVAVSAGFLLVVFLIAKGILDS